MGTKFCIQRGPGDTAIGSDNFGGLPKGIGVDAKDFKAIVADARQLCAIRGPGGGEGSPSLEPVLGRNRISPVSNRIVKMSSRYSMATLDPSGEKSGLSGDRTSGGTSTTSDSSAPG